MSFQVVHPGTFSLLVDGGRPRHRSLGIPVGGAADRSAWQIGNALLGNRPDAVALEMAFSGPSLHATADINVCVFGATFSVQLDGIPCPVAAAISVRAGRRLAIGGASRGVRGYLCVAGGFAAKEILGSRSGLAPVRSNDTLVALGSVVRKRSLEHCVAASLLDWKVDDEPIRVVNGPQKSWFSDECLTQQEFRVAPASDRMGIRLEGNPLTVSRREMVSEPVAPGAIQVTNQGQCIILGVDGQTIGGYPKIAHVIRADLDRLAQLRPGDCLRFQFVTMDEAEEIARTKERRLQTWLKRLELPA